MNLPSEAKRLAEGSRIPTEAVRRLLTSTGLTIERLMLELVPLARDYAAAAVSGYRVGAVVLGNSGALYYGANVEFAGCSLNQTVHAEQSAVVHAASHGETGLTKLAVSAPPCGYCRQFLYELVAADLLSIVLEGGSPTLLTNYLPGAFGPANLGVVGGMLAPQQHRLAWVGTTKSSVAAAMATLEAAKLSYAPYTKAIAAVGLVTRDGRIFAGPYLENAAFNPSVSPFQAAAALLALAGRTWDEVSDAICLQAAGSAVDHAAAARAMLAKIAPHVAVEELLVQADR